MIVRKYWTSITAEIVVHGSPCEVVCYGGSNESMADAEVEAKKKVKIMEAKLNGDSSSLESYTVEIKEELINSIDERNVITRNRYGALVLNSENTIFLDIDYPRTTFLSSLFGLFSAKPKTTNEIKKILFNQVVEVAENSFSQLSFRIYETKRGYRVVAIGENVGPNTELARELFKRFNCDYLYTQLCYKQDCYRARLSPKPGYIRYKALKVKFPRSDDEQRVFGDWLRGYEEKSENYSVCRLVHSVRETRYLDEVIKVHDDYCKVSKNLPLG